MPIDPDILIKKARKKTGLYDLGDDSFYLPLGKLIESAKKEADLTLLGWLVLNIRLGTILCNNLRTRQLNIPKLGKPIEYTMKDSIAYYGYTKLLLTIFARELAGRYKGDSIPRLSVFTLCPGPVATNIAREAPKIFRPLVRLIFHLFFRSPMKASDPIVFYASDPSISGKTDIYLHLIVKKKPDPRTADPETGRKLWEKTKELVESAGTVAGKPGPA